MYGDNHPNVATRLNNLGSVYFTLGEKQKAKTYFQPVHAIFNQFLGPESIPIRKTRPSGWPRANNKNHSDGMLAQMWSVSNQMLAHKLDFAG
jgi:hypothetical protein